MSVLVIKAWRADTRPIDNENNYVSITGRKSGLVAWLFSLFRIDPVTRIIVGTERVEFSSASLAGTQTRFIPLECLSSTYFGYHKPWKAAAAIVLGFVYIGLSIPALDTGFASSSATSSKFFISAAAGLIVGLVYYFFNRTLTLGFTEHSGFVNGIRFKRSFVENKDINERQAASVSIIVQRLIEAKQRRFDYHPALEPGIARDKGARRA
jgi:hypothetical protein